ncbi:flavin-containing monooxygenase [Natronoglycomyces albus]|uniref:NAD(P)-binding domain-containing protein n=1 Tax=Natronoglycomyces albus TaxID=2811108 RepID=A0A895XXF4_9ACTN|nr:NAD(P)-binding domain-containing protein [Natronoglycomyces albus]QSB06308.1 NAD(P)-binding domain-containing protein [Natronoglycomyces albus]
MRPTSPDAYDRGEAVCVIGAGASGLLAIKNLREYGFEVDCYERDTVIGGLWNPSNQHSPLYTNTHLVTSRIQTEIPDFPMPDDWPDYPSAAQTLAYLKRYASHFDLEKHIWFGSEIEQITPVDGSRFEVSIKAASGSASRRLRYGAVIIATGHHWDPNIPSYPGLERYTGRTLHSSALKSAAPIRGKKVLVVGGGNSGTDLACEAALNATQCWHSTRRGYWHVPKYHDGQPFDRSLRRINSLPQPLRRFVTKLHVERATSTARRLRESEPDHAWGDEEPVRNGRYFEHLGEGSIEAKPEITRFEGSQVAFSDGSIVKPDLVIFATGFQWGIDCVDGRLLGLDAALGRPQLNAHMFSPLSETLAVAGLVEPGIGVFPVVHWQTHAIARWLQVRSGDPARATAFREQVVAETKKTTPPVSEGLSPRHRLAVSSEEYLPSLARIIRTLEADE